MYTNGVSVLSPAIPGGSHFENENGLARAKPLVLLCCFCVRIAPDQSNPADKSAGATLDKFREFRRHRAAPVSVSDGLHRNFLIGSTRAARKFCLRAAQLYGSVERASYCLLSIVHGGIKRHV
jgi:hypothetical protein